jgi:hypothetical protein
VLRKLATGFGVALALFGGMAFASGTASAGTDPHDGGTPTQPGTWVYVKWYQGISVGALWQCGQDANNLYPGRSFSCRSAGGTTQLWVLY